MEAQPPHGPNRDEEFCVRAEQSIAGVQAWNEQLRRFNKQLGIRPVTPPRPQLRLIPGGLTNEP